MADLISFTLRELKQYVKNFCAEHQFPIASTEHLIKVFDMVTGSANEKIFKKLVDDYWKDRKMNYDKVFEQLDVLASDLKLHSYSLHLLYLICLSPRTRKLYEINGLDKNIFYDSIDDLRISMMECYNLYEIWGTHYGRWQMGFCNMELITFGRLQFGISNLWCDYDKKDFHVKKNDRVIETHIPSGKPLNHDECLESYAKAEAYYRKKYSQDFGDKAIPVVCFSWFLYPPIKEALVDNGNIISFINDYDIFNSDSRNNDKDLWRVFGKDYKKAPEELPQNTVLQRNIAKWLLKGNHLGYGHGILFVKAGKIVS